MSENGKILIDKKACVYVLGCKDSGMVKIGISTKPNDRIARLSSNFLIKSPKIFISQKTNEPFSVESEIHRVVSKYLEEWRGVSDTYKKESFKYSFKKATWIVRNVLQNHKLNMFYRDLDYGESYWDYAQMENSYERDHPRCFRLIDTIEAHERVGKDRFRRLRRYKDPRTGEIRKTIEVWI